ncbi:MAG: acetolactate synthase large subunit [Chloroflexi bacterium]|nr:acetolactate synthase large subunit [Chloroflexota bacterium]
MKGSDILVRCLENEGVEYIFGLPGEEILDLMDSLSRSSIRFVTVRHEQGAAFMADVYGRLTGRPGVCLATLGPGATNLITGVADAFLDRAPLVAITGQISRERTHKESHQFLHIVEMFRPITKWNTQIESPEVIPEVVRKAFKLAQLEKPGPTHLELPEDVAQAEAPPGAGVPLEATEMEYPVPNLESVERAAEVLVSARHPLILAGNGVLRRRANAELAEMARAWQIPVAHTFMGKGTMDPRDPLCLLSVGLQARDWVMCRFDPADVVVAIGYDMAEYSPQHWNERSDKQVIHIDIAPGEVDEHYPIAVEVLGDISQSLKALASLAPPRPRFEGPSPLKEIIIEELKGRAEDDGFPVKPQRAISDLRRALGEKDILLSDVGAHKLWLARMYPTYQPNTVLISNGLAAMGFAVPGAVAAKLVHPERQVIAVTGDGGFMMNSQELETAKRLGISFVTVVWVDGSYGVIEWKQRTRFGHDFGTRFTNPDFAQYARSLGLPGFKVERAGDFLPALRQALALKLPSVIEMPVDYRENLRLTERLGHIVCPV